MKTILLLTISLLIHRPESYGQQTSIISGIDSIASKIDSVKNLSVTIVDGQFRPKGKGKWAGYSDCYYRDSASTKLLRVVHGQGKYNPGVTTYYFLNDNLILVRMENAQFYFQDGKFILKLGTEGRDEQAKYFLQNAVRYLMDDK
ncbi:MAG TPA: hypothetical protein VGO58_04420 [Chitinophagaceae bacterium]|jgi:hypothetical protein|nr:hypothetical protein [Chitinophagaceae bacterium]